jgi:WD40 repeat protein/mono/diheme cytochrome c family protein
MRYAVPLVAAWCAFSLAAIRADEANKDSVSFSKQIAPLLVKSCQACHGPQDPMGSYQLYTYELMRKAGDTGSAPVTPGKPEDSELYRLITHEDPDQRMPKEADALPAEQVALVKKWIEQGAKFDGPDAKAQLTTLIPKNTQPDPPEAYRVPVPVTAVAFHPGGNELAVGGYHEITIWNPADGKLLRRIKNVAQRVYGLKYNADGSLLAVAAGTPGQLGEAKLFNPADGTLVKDLGSMNDVAYDIAFSPASDRVAACSADRSIRVWNVASGKEELLIEDHADWVMAVTFNNDGTRLASASRDKTSKVFDAKTGDAVATYTGHGDTVFGVAFSADGKQVFSSGADKKVHVWNPADGKKAADIGGFGLEVYELAVNGDKLFACSADKQARLFDAGKRNQIKAFAGHADWIYALSYHDGSKRLATGGYDGEVKVWNIDDGKQVIGFKAAPGYVSATAEAKK